jgi:FPC/CPF motif-containing protein YcgG
MYPDVVGCCPKPTAWIFVYQNDEVFSICKDHFYSLAHRCEVKTVINFQTKIQYEPEMIFPEFPIRFEHNNEVFAHV